MAKNLNVNLSGFKRRTPYVSLAGGGGGGVAALLEEAPTVAPGSWVRFPAQVNQAFHYCGFGELLSPSELCGKDKTLSCPAVHHCKYEPNTFLDCLHDIQWKENGVTDTRNDSAKRPLSFVLMLNDPLIIAARVHSYCHAL